MRGHDTIAHSTEQFVDPVMKTLATSQRIFLLNAFRSFGQKLPPVIHNDLSQNGPTPTKEESEMGLDLRQRRTASDVFFLHKHRLDRVGEDNDRKYEHEGLECGIL